MRYLVRAIKYFFYFVFLLIVLMAILVLLNFASADPATMFKNGYDSLWQIALMFACVAAVYPMFGYLQKDLCLDGEYADIRDPLVAYMNKRGYVLEVEEDENLCFRFKSMVNRISRMLEDRITFTRQAGGFRVEGLRKDVVRVVHGVEYSFRHPGED